eukprot:scaffold7359_cov255-Pinguiococcus_pyrenoidosus.AAC.17
MCVFGATEQEVRDAKCAGCKRRFCGALRTEAVRKWRRARPKALVREPRQMPLKGGVLFGSDQSAKSCHGMGKYGRKCRLANQVPRAWDMQGIAIVGAA